MGLWTLASALALLSGYAGLLASYHLDAPSGPAIVLMAGGIWFLSMLAGRYNSLRTRLMRDRHLAG